MPCRKGWMCAPADIDRFGQIVGAYLSGLWMVWVIVHSLYSSQVRAAFFDRVGSAVCRGDGCWRTMRPFQLQLYKGKTMIRRILRTAITLLFTSTCFSTMLSAQPAPGAPPLMVESDDPRVQNRSYLFDDTGEQMPYSVFVSSKVKPDTPAPLVVVLHGLGIGPGFMLRGKILDLAEEGGYILVAPMGYNVGGWWGSPVITFGDAPVEPANLAELSEKDAMNVFAMVREEFNIDPDRTYLMGHSMGGAGTFHLGVKHAQYWAALGPIAPAAFLLDPASLAAVKDTMPVILVHGAADELVPVDLSRRWADWMKENGVEHRYVEVADATHGPIIDAGMADIFAFFAQHRRGD
jgi:poly(3-hydroxybutyrate) depolymerase